MKTLRSVLALSAMAAGGALSPLSSAVAQDSTDGHAVFVMTNNANSNEVIAYERTAYGTLHDPRTYQTGGRGSGGRVEPRRAH